MWGGGNKCFPHCGPLGSPFPSLSTLATWTHLSLQRPHAWSCPESRPRPGCDAHGNPCQEGYWLSYQALVYWKPDVRVFKTLGPGTFVLWCVGLSGWSIHIWASWWENPWAPSLGTFRKYKQSKHWPCTGTTPNHNKSPPGSLKPSGPCHALPQKVSLCE